MYQKCCKCSCNNIFPVDNDKCYEDNCCSVQNNMDIYDECECGFDEEFNFFPENPTLAESYVARQKMDKTFIPCVGLKMGTIYPELVSPYEPGQSMATINYLKARNEIGKGCNEC